MPPAATPQDPARSLAAELGFAIAVVAAAVLACFPLQRYLPVASLALVFVCAVLAVAVRSRKSVAVAAALLSSLGYNFFFTEPRLTLHVIPRDELLTLGFFLAVSIVVGVLGARLRQQVDAMRDAARRTRALYDFTRRALTATTDYDMAWSVVSHVNATLRLDAALMRPGTGGELEVVAGAPPIDGVDPASFAAADWAWRNARPAGWGTDTLPGTD